MGGAQARILHLPGNSRTRVYIPKFRMRNDRPLLMRQLCKPRGLGQNFLMTQLSLPIPGGQREIEQLLIALAKKQPISAKPAPIAYGG